MWGQVDGLLFPVMLFEGDKIHIIGLYIGIELARVKYHR